MSQAIGGGGDAAQEHSAGELWKAVSGEEEAPGPTDIRRGFGEVLVAAAVEGAIFALVRAAVNRSAAEGTRRLTGYWPGEDSEAGQAKEKVATGKGT